MIEKASRNPDELRLKALFDAIANRDRALVRHLIKESPTLVRRVAMSGATRADPKSYFFEAIDHYAYAGDTPLHLAAAAQAADVVADLISDGADVFARNRRGAQPLHYAADSNPDSPRWDPQGQAVVIQALLSAGADPNSQDRSGVGPLHRAVRNRCVPAVRTLLAGGADARRKNESGSTPLHLAVQTTGRGGSGSAAARDAQAEIIELLLSHGARTSDKNAAGKTAAQCATTDWLRALFAR